MTPIPIRFRRLPATDRTLPGCAAWTVLVRLPGDRERAAGTLSVAPDPVAGGRRVRGAFDPRLSFPAPLPRTSAAGLEGAHRAELIESLEHAIRSAIRNGI